MSGPQILGPPAGAPLRSWPGPGKPQGRGSGPQTWVVFPPSPFSHSQALLDRLQAQVPAVGATWCVVATHVFCVHLGS